MKILGGELEQSSGEVMLQTGLRLGKLNQNQFALRRRARARRRDAGSRRDVARHEGARPASTPMRTPATRTTCARRSSKRSSPSTAATTPRRAPPASSPTPASTPSLHNGPMREVAPGWKLRVLLAQALFSQPDVLLLDEPTNNLDINSIRWLEGVLNDYDATMVIISHDRHFLNQVCTHMADLDFGQIKIYPGNYDDFMLASVQARERVEAANAKAKDRISDLQEFVRRFSANASKARQATSRRKLIEKIKIEEIKPSSRQNPVHPFRPGQEAVSQCRLGRAPELPLPALEGGSAQEHLVQRRSRRAHRHHRPERHRQDHADAPARRRPAPDEGQDHLGGERAGRLHAAGSAGRVREEDRSVHLDERVARRSRTTTRPSAPRSGACCSPATRSASRSRCCRAARRAA